jgi:Flp pilus assembly pilin Flp
MEREMIELITLRLKALIGDKRGVTAVEYTIIAALIIGVLAAGFTTLGTSLNTKLTGVTTAV